MVGVVVGLGEMAKVEFERCNVGVAVAVEFAVEAISLNRGTCYTCSM